MNEAEIRLLIGLAACLLSGFLIGTEREMRGKPAGISTQSLVIGGAFLFATLSSLVDPASKSRIAANVVTGVGFLGAGIILKADGGKISNLTTAASIWFAASIGMALAWQFYVMAAAGVIYALLIPRIPHIKTIRGKIQRVKENLPDGE